MNMWIHYGGTYLPTYIWIRKEGEYGKYDIHRKNAILICARWYRRHRHWINFFSFELYHLLFRFLADNLLNSFILDRGQGMASLSAKKFKTVENVNFVGSIHWLEKSFKCKFRHIYWHIIFNYSFQWRQSGRKWIGAGSEALTEHSNASNSRISLLSLRVHRPSDET